MIKLVLFLSGSLCGWFLRSAYNAYFDKGHPEINYADAHPYGHPEQPMQDMSLTDWDNVVDEQFAERESPPEDVPDEIEVPPLPFEEPAKDDEEDEDEEEEEDHPNGFHPVLDAPDIEIITEDQYLDEYFAYGKETLLYFCDIDELTYSDEDRVDDKARIVGQRIDLLFDEHGKDGALYVRNNRLSIDFMIEEKHGHPYWYDESE